MLERAHCCGVARGQWVCNFFVKGEMVSFWSNHRQQGLRERVGALFLSILDGLSHYFLCTGLMGDGKCHGHVKL